jgi:hypothetical protein
MQAGLVYIAGTAGKMVVSSAITPIVNSTISLITSLRNTGTQVPTLEDTINKYDIQCTLQTIEATTIALKCDVEPLKTAASNVVAAVQLIHQLLTRIADITASHQSGYISRWRQLDIQREIDKLEMYMDILSKRFKLMCDIRSVVD